MSKANTLGFTAADYHVAKPEREGYLPTPSWWHAAVECVLAGVASAAVAYAVLSILGVAS